MRVLGSGCDDFPYMLSAVFAPVPHEKRMRAMIGVAAPVHLNVTRIVSKLTFILIAQHKHVASLRQQAIKKCDVTGLESVINLVVTRMRNDQHASYIEFFNRLLPET